MKKILFLINTLRGGGAEKVLVDLANSLTDENVEVTVQTVIDDGVYCDSLDPRIRYKTIIKTKSKLLRKLYSFFVIKMLSPKTVYRLFIRDDYDYEVAFLEGLSTRLVSASTNKKSRKIAWVHTDLISYPESYKVYKSESNEQKAYTRFDSVACVSDGVLESFVKKYGQVIHDIRTVYNILDEETIIKLSSEECEIRKSAPLIVSVGRLTKQKGFDRLLRVKKRLDDENVPSELWIVGEGEERSALESFIDEHKVRDVKLVGFEQNPYKFMAQADIFVSSSLAEGYSTVVTESVVLGVPVISTNTAGAGEPVQTPRCSVIVEDEDGLYNAIKEALTDKAVLDSLKNDAYNKRNFFKKERLLKDIKQFLKID